MERNGHIQIPRNDQAMELNRDDPVAFSIFMWLLSEAAWKDHERDFLCGNGKTIRIQEQRGHKTIRQSMIARRYGLTVRQVQGIMGRLEKRGFIEGAGVINGVIGRVIYHIVNYDTYQPPACDYSCDYACDIPEEEYYLEEKYTINNCSVSPQESRGNRAQPAIPFERYISEYQCDDQYASAIQYFMEAYRRFRGEQHPNLKPDQWDKIVANLSHIEDEIPGLCTDAPPVDIEPIILMYFQTEFAEDCDYRMLHFSSEGVLDVLFYRWERETANEAMEE